MAPRPCLKRSLRFLDGFVRGPSVVDGDIVLRLEEETKNSVILLERGCKVGLLLLEGDFEG